MRHPALAPLVIAAFLLASPAQAEMVGYWSFDDGTGATLTDLSGYGGHGTLQGTTLPTWAAGHTGAAGDHSLHFTGSGTTNNSSTAPHVVLGNLPQLKITGDQTISMWLYPTDPVTRQNPYAKAYGGSGTITQEPNRALTYYYGRNASGGNGGPYDQISSPQLTANAWNHVTIVRDLTNNDLRWYVNGNTRSEAPLYNPAIAGNNPAYFGRGYRSSYRGRIDDALIFNDALNSLEVAALAKPQRSISQLTLCPDDWLKGWASRQAITVSKDATATDLAGFPVPIQITDASHRVFDSAHANGHDIVFTTADGRSVLPHEIETFSKAPGSEELVAWVKTPLSASEDTTIYMYSGGPDLGDLSSADTWDPNFKMVQHLNETAGTRVDSTSYGNHMTPQNGVVAAPGVADGADAFGGYNSATGRQYLERGDTLGITSTESFTLEGWVNLVDDASNQNQYPIAKLSRATIRAFTGGTPNFGMLWDDANAGYGQWSSGLDITGDWHHVAMVYDASLGTYGTMFLYLDGTELSGGRPVPAALLNGSNYYIGTWASTYGWVEGTIDEVRISEFARSADWLLATFNLIDDPDSYIAFGDIQSIPEPTSLALLGLGALALLRRRR